MIAEALEYQDEDVLLRGYVAYDETLAAKRPTVMVVHDWTGCNDFAQEKARELAKLGYVGFAIDMYGNGQNGLDTEEKRALMTPLMDDRRALIQRIQKALYAVSLLPMVDPQKIAVIGFCFGGLCALDLARSGANVLGVVSFHGLLFAPKGVEWAPIKAKVLALHGYDDPMVMPEQVRSFEDEMKKNKVDWQLHTYGNTMHAFTNPEANDPAFGTVYNLAADHRSWIAMKNFLNEIFRAADMT